MGDSKPLASMQRDAAEQGSAPVTHVATLGTPEKPKRKSSRWRRFWMCRSKARMVWALALALLALLAAIYLALSESDQAVVVAAIQATGQALGATGLRVGVIAALVVGTGASLALLFSPTSAGAHYPDPHPDLSSSSPVSATVDPGHASAHRQSRNPPLSASTIPPVSVYLDAENIITAEQIPPFLDYLRKTLDGRRADLLYFVDVWEVHRNTYPILSRYGFVPVHASHNPTGEKVMFEAVDRELAMHAVERALLGPVRQEFIIVSNDGDYAPLISRLLALGHKVQIWSVGHPRPYVALKDLARVFPERRYQAIDLTTILGSPSSEIHPAERRDVLRAKGMKELNQQLRARRRPQSARKVKKSTGPKPPSWSEPHIELPGSLSQGQARLYYAIVATASARQFCEQNYQGDARNPAFANLLGEKLQSRLASVGYQAGSKVEFWRLHLVAVGLLAPGEISVFPAEGATAPIDAARQFYAMVSVVADAAINMPKVRDDGAISVHNILSRLTSDGSALAAVPALSQLISENNQRPTHVRYLMNCAREIGIVQFDDVSTSPDLFHNPRPVDNGTTDGDTSVQ